jgi:hypothetical protein
MKTMLIKKLKLALEMAVVVDIIALIFKYSEIYLGAFTLGCSTYNIIELVIRHKH